MNAGWIDFLKKNQEISELRRMYESKLPPFLMEEKI